MKLHISWSATLHVIRRPSELRSDIKGYLHPRPFISQLTVEQYSVEWYCPPEMNGLTSFYTSLVEWIWSPRSASYGGRQKSDKLHLRWMSPHLPLLITSYKQVAVESVRHPINTDASITVYSIQLWEKGKYINHRGELSVSQCRFHHRPLYDLCLVYSSSQTSWFSIYH